MDEKKQRKLFTWRQGVLLGLAAAGGVGLNAYRTYKMRGPLDSSWLATAIISLALCGAILFFVARHANKPEKEP